MEWQRTQFKNAEAASREDVSADMVRSRGPLGIYRGVAIPQKLIVNNNTSTMQTMHGDIRKFECCKDYNGFLSLQNVVADSGGGGPGGPGPPF